MNWYEILLNVVGIFAAILAIADFVFSKAKKGKKILIIILAVIISFFSYEKIDSTIKNKIKEENIKNLKIDAKSVYHSIVISGWENPGDFIGYTTQLASFYRRHDDRFKTEAKIYESELNNWRALLVERRSNGKSLSLDEEHDLRGLVKSARDQLLQIIQKY